MGKLCTLTDHAGRRRCECHLGTKFWHPLVEVARGAVLAPVSDFERQCKYKFIRMKLNSHLNHFQQPLFQTFPRLLINIIFFGLTNTGAKTAPQVPKMEYFDGRVPIVSSRVTLATSEAGVVCHICIYIIQCLYRIKQVFSNRILCSCCDASLMPQN